VSVDNIKIRDVQGSGTETFTLAPSFDQLFSVDGKTTYQMKNLLPGDFVKIYSDKFAILAGPIPAGGKQLVFKAVQTYANGEVVRWIEIRHAGEPEPAHPAPVLDVK